MTPTSTTGNWNRQGGFTLIELAVVVFLIGLFSLVALPFFSGSGRNDVHLSARKLSGTIKYLFNEAALTGREHRLIINLDHDSFHARAVDADGELKDVGRWGEERALEGEVRFERVILPGRGGFTAGTVTVHVLPSGWIEENVIQLVGKHDESLTLHVNPLTGSSEIFEGKREF